MSCSFQTSYVDLIIFNDQHSCWSCCLKEKYNVLHGLPFDTNKDASRLPDKRFVLCTVVRLINPRNKSVSHVRQTQYR